MFEMYLKVNHTINPQVTWKADGLLQISMSQVAENTLNWPDCGQCEVINVFVICVQNKYVLSFLLDTVGS